MKLARKFLSGAILAVLFLAAAVPGACAGQEGDVINEHWGVMRISGDEAGWIHEKIFKIVKDGRVHYRSETATSMEMKRFGQKVSVLEEGWALEDAEGRLVRMQRKSIMSETETIYEIEVQGSKALFTITTMGKARPNSIPWDPAVVGPMGIYFQRIKEGFEPGTTYTYKSFAPEYAKAATMTVVIEGLEETELLDGESAELIHAVSTMDLLPGIDMHEWWTDKGHYMKTSMNMVGLTLETLRAGEKRAMTTGSAELKTDVLIESMARSNINLPNPYSLDFILYSFEAKDASLGLPENLDDLRQKVLGSGPNTARVLIKAVVPGSSQKRPMTDPPGELREYLDPNPFLQCDDPALIAKALEVVGNETDAWKAACLLERFVFEYISDKNFGTAFASASEVLENRSGDCSEHGVLLAALCRAAGIPSRVAMGYMYLGGIFGGHMWVEVWIEGGWYAIDGVMGIGRVDPTHICFTTSSLRDGGLGASFAQAVQGLGNLKLTILEFGRGEKTIKVGESFKDYVIDGDTYTNTLYGISLTKPAGYDFENYERDFSGVDFTLVEMDGRSEAGLQALPAAFSFSIDEFRKQLKRSAEILYEMPRRIDGRTGAIFMVEAGKKKGRVLALVDQDTCFVLRMDIKDEERDVEAFERMVKTITFE